MQRQLSEFVEHARQKGVDPATIMLLLRSAGWKDREVANVLAARELSIPIPARRGIGDPRDAFLYLLAFTALYVWIISIICLIFIYIGFQFPDPAQRVSYYEVESTLSTIRMLLATLIVFYPLFFFVWRLILRDRRAAPENATAMWRWFIFASLFVGAVTIVSDVVTAIYYFVEGDLTTSFVLKVLTLLAVAGLASGYLALVLRGEAKVETVT